MARDDDQFLRSTPNASTRAGVRDDDESSDLDARAQDLELGDPEEQQFLRGSKRPAVRRGVPKRTANRLKTALLAGTALAVLLAAWFTLYNYGTRSWRFRIDSSDNLEIQGLGNVQRAHVMEVMGGDIGRNIFFVPLEERKKQLEQIPWVESATIIRLLPDRLRVHVVERRPVAFVRIGSKVSLIDGSGALMEMPPNSKSRYSFPLIVGMASSDPLSTRAARMRVYTRLMTELDSEGGGYSKDISEVDLADPDDVKVMVSDDAGAVVVHLGDQDFLARYKIYVANVQQWRQQFNKLESVDLRYERQIIVNPDSSARGGKAMARPASK